MAVALGEMNILDLGVVALYFISIIGVGVLASFLNRGSVAGYFLAGRSMHWFFVGASLFASNIGSGHFIGLAGSAAASGIGIGVFELHALFMMIILGWLFVPVYLASGVFTMPEYLQKRFGGQRIRIYLSILSLILYVFTKIAADLYSGALFIQMSTSISLYPAIGILLFISAFFTILGGLSAVMYTDFIQTSLMVLGALLLMILSLIHVGSVPSLLKKFEYSIPNTTLLANIEGNVTSCGTMHPSAFHLYREVGDSDLPWSGVLFGLTISATWYWCTDQVIVQRSLAARNLSHAKLGCVLCGYLKITPFFLLVIPGMISRALYPDTVGCIDPQSCLRACGQPSGCTNVAYPTLVLKLLPSPLKGLMMSVMLASLVSSLSGVFNSSSTIFTMDVWTRIRKNCSETEIMLVSRVFVLGMVGVGVAWIPIVQKVSELFHYIQSVTSFLAPPVCAVFVLGIFWKRANESGAFWSLIVGLVLGIGRFVWENAYGRAAACGMEDPRPPIIKNFHYFHFGILLFFICIVVCGAISILTPPIPEKRLYRLLFWNRFSQKMRVEFDEMDANAAAGASQQNTTDEKALQLEVVGARERPLPIPPNPLNNNHSANGADNNYEINAQGEHMLPKKPLWMRGVMFVCGIENMDTEEKQKQKEETERLKNSPEHRLEAMRDALAGIIESDGMRRICSVNALALLTVGVFIWAYLM